MLVLVRVLDLLYDQYQGSSKMGFVSNQINKATKKRLPVYGTQNYFYDTEEFDRIRDDGVSILDLMPECRVFVGGVEVTKDVISTSISHAISGGVGASGTGGGSTCTITLANPRGKYEITKQDLTGKWRADKDILEMYDYDYLIKDSGFDIKKSLFKFLESQDLNNAITDTISGASGNATIGAIGGAVLDKGLKAIKQAQKPKGATRMLFEVKHVSGLYKRVGDIVFDYKDPVYVFMKGRFSPLWYFAFSGVVTTWDEADAYGDSNTINLKCESILQLLKKTKLQERGALYPAGNFETAVVSANTKSATSPYDSVSSLSLQEMIKSIIFGRDYAHLVKNNHVASLFSNASSYEFAYNHGGATTGLSYLKDLFPFKDKFNFTTAPIDFTEAGAPNISDINTTAKGPNSLPLSHWQLAYFQYNELSLDSHKNLHYYLRDSVRFWESNPTVSSAANNSTFTGWSDGQAFGVLGAHPALTYKFIDNFNILPGIWKEVSADAKKPSAKLDSLVLSPYDKIVESVAGSATEAAIGPNMGSNLNTFRPRLFLVMPKKFTGDHPVTANAFGAFSLLKETATTPYDILAKLSALDYSTYTTPMGDLIVEPNWYDGHPLDHIPNSEAVVVRGDTKTTKIRAIQPEDTNKAAETTNLKAYDYATDNNHPFFIMQKDLSRLTQTFSPELIKTKITVVGSNGSSTSATEAVTAGEDMTQLSIFGIGENSTSALQHGFYIADGIKDKFRRMLKSFSSVQGALKVQAEAVFIEYYQKEFFVVLPTILSMSLYDYYKKMVRQSLSINYNQFKKYKSDGTLPFNVSTKLIKDLLLFVSTDDNLDKLTGVLPDIEWVVANGRGIPINAIETEHRFFNTFLPSISTYLNIAFTLDTQISALVPTFNDSAISGSITYDQYKKDHTRNPALNELMNLFLIGLIYDTSVGFSPESTIETRKLLGNLNKFEDPQLALKVRTRKDLNNLFKMGFYDPQLDMVRRYGYNTNQEQVNNFYVRNGREATHYASIIFNKLFSGAFTFNMDIVGRPELQLNRTYYCQRKDAIGLLTKYTLGWTHGSDFSSQIDLTYIRKNAITYMYSLGDLDIIQSKANGNSNDNTAFKDAADKYYAWKKLSQLLVNSSSAVANTGATGTLSKYGIPGGTVVGEEIAGVTGSLVGKLLDKIGGLYSAHPYTGTLAYDKSSIDIETADVTTAVAENLAADADSIQTLYTTFFGEEATAALNYAVLGKLNQAITTVQTDCSNLYTKYVAAISRTDVAKKELTKKKEELTALEKDNTTNAKAIKQVNEEIKKLTNEITTLKSTIDQSNTSFNKWFTLLYGAPATYKQTDYGEFVYNQTVAAASSRQIADAPNVTISDVSFPVALIVLSDIQISLNITIDTVKTQTNCLYYKLLEWIVPHSAFKLVPDMKTAKLNTKQIPVSFAPFGQIKDAYFVKIG